nr:hypothetical protein [Tanacetum cinerariifolium]
MEEEDSRALKRLSEIQEDKAAKKQKLDEEVEELRKHLQIVSNDDDVYTEATHLALKRKYPLTRFTLDQMLNNVRLKVEEKSDVSLELLSFGVDAAKDFKENMLKLEDITYSDDEEDVGAEADFTNLKTSITVCPILTTRVHKDHHVTQIIGDLSSATQTRSRTTVAKDQAMQEELLQFKMQKVWVLVDLPHGKRAIGHTQDEGIDYEEVFAPVARIEAIRLFLAYTSFMGFMVYQMDVKSAFLYETIKKELYVCQPLGFEDSDYPDKVYKVVMALYRLHQALRAWYETFENYLLDNGFQRGKIDQTLFIKRQKGDILLVQIYVDDIIFCSTNKDLCKAFKKLMKDKFQMSLMGELIFCLGLQVKQKKDEIFISQDKNVAEILRKFVLTDGKSASTPIDTEKPLLKDSDGEDVDVHTYRSMSGSLMYLTSSRPDIIPDQMVSGKDSSNLLMADNLPKIVWYSTHHVVLIKSWLVQKQTALGQTEEGVVTEVTIRDSLCLDDAKGELSSYTIKYSSPALIQKVFANMRMVGKGCSRVETLLFEGMIMAQQVGEGAAELNDEDVPAAGVTNEGATSVNDDEVSAAVDDPSIPSPTPSTPPPSTSQDIPSTSQRVKKLKRMNKLKVLKLRRLKKVGTSQRVETYDDIVMDDVSKQERIIADKDVTLKDVAAVAKDVQDAEIEEKPTKLEQVVEVVTTAKLITKVVTAASATITTAAPQLTTAAAPTLTTAPSVARRRNGVIIRDPEENEKEDNVVKRYQALKRKPQTKVQARKNMMIYLRNVVGFKMDYFKGMTYDDIHPIFEKKFNSNVAFLQKTKEQMEEEDIRAVKRLSESQEDKAAKKQKVHIHCSEASVTLGRRQSGGFLKHMARRFQLRWKQALAWQVTAGKCHGYDPQSYSQNFDDGFLYGYCKNHKKRAKNRTKGHENGKSTHEPGIIKQSQPKSTLVNLGQLTK